MHHYKQSQFCAEAQQKKAVLILGMVGVVFQAGILVSEDGRRLIKRDTMLALVLAFFPVIPRKGELSHNAMIMPLSLLHKGIL
jgi:hypothetical protein